MNENKIKQKEKKQRKITMNIEKIKNKIHDAELILILAHGDLDGIVSAIMMTKICEYYSHAKIETVFTLPKWIYKHTNTDVYDLIIVVDLAVNNRNPDSAKDFIEKNRNKLLWIDHHYCPEDITEIITDVSYRSCVQFINTIFSEVKFNERINKLIRYAHESDMGKGNSIYQKALKVNQRSDETRYEIYRMGINHPEGELYNKSKNRLKRKAIYYDREIAPKVNYVIKDLTEFRDNIAVVDIRDYRDERIDMTLLAFELYKQAEIIIIRYYGSNEEKREFLKVSRRPDVKLNLVDVFNLKSGAPFKVTVRNNFDDINQCIEYIKEKRK